MNEDEIKMASDIITKDHRAVLSLVAKCAARALGNDEEGESFLDTVKISATDDKNAIPPWNEWY